MAGPIEKTMQVLASTANAQALDVLIAALDVTDEEIRQAAVAALIKRNSSRGQLEIIRRLPRLGDGVRDSLESQVGRMSSPLRQALLHGDEELRAHGLELVRATECFEQLPTLLEMLKDERGEVTHLAAEGLRELIDRLYEHCETGNASRRPDRYLRNAEQVKHNVLTGFDRALANFEELSHQQEVLEAVLILGKADNFAVKKVLTQGSPERRGLAGAVLTTSRHPGVMQLVLDYLSKNYPPPKIFEAVGQRDDPEFVAHLLRWFPKRLTPTQQKNLRQIESVAWVDAADRSLEMIPPSLQAPLVEFVTATGLPAETKLTVQEWVVRHGAPEGRLAASAVLGSMDDGAVQNIISSSLESENEDIQAWATSQLRSQGIPEALSMLINRLDSPLPAVRDAAREELKGFDVPAMLEMFEDLDPLVCLRAGKLIEKIDPDCHDKLRLELASPIRRKRIRAARAARMLGMHEKVFPSLKALLEDQDPLVRRTGIDALATIPSDESFQAIAELLEDDNARVREEAARALNALGGRDLTPARSG